FACELLDLATDDLHVARIYPEPAASLAQPLEVQLEQPRLPATAGDRLKETIAIVQAAIEHGHALRRHAVDQHAVRSAAHTSVSADAKAARSPRALARVSSSSRSGIESATMPPPARRSTRRPLTVIVRMRM